MCCLCAVLSATAATGAAKTSGGIPLRSLPSFLAEVSLTPFPPSSSLFNRFDIRYKSTPQIMSKIPHSPRSNLPFYEGVIHSPHFRGASPVPWIDGHGPRFTLVVYKGLDISIFIYHILPQTFPPRLNTLRTSTPLPKLYLELVPDSRGTLAYIRTKLKHIMTLRGIPALSVPFFVLESQRRPHTPSMPGFWLSI